MKKYFYTLLTAMCAQIPMSIASQDDIDQTKIIRVNALMDIKFSFPSVQEVKNAALKLPEFFEDKHGVFIHINGISYSINTADNVLRQVNDTRCIQEITKLSSLTLSTWMHESEIIWMNDYEINYYILCYRLPIINNDDDINLIHLTNFNIPKSSRLIEGNIYENHAKLELVSPNMHKQYRHVFEQPNNPSNYGFIKTDIGPLKEILARYVQQNIKDFGGQEKISEIFGEESDITLLIFPKKV